jgi:hypothetical protein
MATAPGLITQRPIGHAAGSVIGRVAIVKETNQGATNSDR